MEGEDEEEEFEIEDDSNMVGDLEEVEDEDEINSLEEEYL